MRRRTPAVALFALAALIGGALPAAAADPAPLTGVVSDNPVGYTPHVLDGTVWAMTVVGDTVIVGGDFTEITDNARRHTYARTNLFAFDLRDGTIRDFAPYVDGTVYALAAGPDGTVFAGGAFTKVGDDHQRGITRLDLDGDRIGSFRATADGDVRTLAVRGDQVYAGGMFSRVNGITRRGLARLDTGSGAVDRNFDARLVGPSPRRTWVYDFDISPDGRRLVAIGMLLTAGDLDRDQIAVLDLTRRTAPVTGWYTDSFKQKCQPTYEAYLRQVRYSPDSSYFVVATTGGTSSATNICDAAARFQSDGNGRHNPVWVQRTGGNSLFAVAITKAAVYLGGHQEYMDNPLGHKSKPAGQPAIFQVGPGAVRRPGIGAVDPATGKTLTWNPTRTRGAGVRVFVTVPQGLLVGSDTDELGHEYHGRIGMFPPS